MNAIALPALFSVHLFFSTTAVGQLITGKVLDTETQKRIAYVHVSVEGNKKGTVTDQFGNFSLEISETTELRFSSIGYITHYEQLNPASDTSFTVYLIPNTHLLSEVFVYSSRINILNRPERTPIKVAGLLTLNNPKPIETGSWKWDKIGFNNSGQDGFIPIFGIGGTLYGPFSYFSAQEKEKRKMKAEIKREKEMNAYHTSLMNENFKQETLKALSMTVREYDSLVIIFNQHHTELVVNKSEDEAMSLLFLFLQERMEE